MGWTSFNSEFIMIRILLLSLALHSSLDVLFANWAVAARLFSKSPKAFEANQADQTETPKYTNPLSADSGGSFGSVVLIAFKVFDQPVDVVPEGVITLKQEENFFSFEFVASGIADPSQNNYAYRLEGFDKEWMYSGTRHYASYTNLDGGEYIFHAKTVSADGVWNENGLSLKILIVPAWWNTWTFRILIIFVLLGVVFLAFRFRINMIDKQRRSLEIAVEEKTALLRETNEHLRKSEETFRAMAENTSDIITRVDRTYSIRYLNNAAGRIAGVTMELGLGRPLGELGFPTDLLNLWESTLDSVFHSKQNKLMEFQLPNGIWLESLICPEFDAHGEVETAISVSRDITVRKQVQDELGKAKETAEKALEGSKRLTAILESTTDLVGMADMQGQLVYMNRAGRKQMGISEDQSLDGIRFDSLYSPQSMQTMMEIGLPHAVKHGSWSGELTLLHRQTKQEIPVSLVGLVHYGSDGAPAFLSAILRDISEQKHVQEELTAAKRTTEEALAEARRLAEIIESTTDYVGIADLEGNSLYVNRAGLRMVGKDENIKHHFNVAMCHPESVRPALMGVLGGVLQGIPWTGETLIAHRDGHEIPVSAAIFPLRDSSGEINAAAAMFRDITRQKQDELDLQEAKEQAEIANRAKSQFLANMSHELRTPLNGILGYTQILQKDKHLLPVHKEQVSVIESCGEHLLNLINEVLDLSKIESGRMDLAVSDFNFTDFLEGIAEMIGIRARQKGLTFMFEVISPLPIAVRADEKRLRQILINLLANAVKYTDEGGVVLKVGYLEERMCFQVEDTGVGIPEEKLRDIFLPFYQVHDAKRSIDGSGLGLAITHQLVELMGGDLDVKSEQGKGSIFRLRISLTELDSAVVESAPAVRSAIGYSGSRKRVLIADDKVENRSVLVHMLRALGFDCREATDGHGCLQILSEWTPDIIFMDLRMPVLSGFETTKRIRTMEEYDKVPIVAISASAFDFTKQESLDAGCDDFISKPFREKQLLEILGHFLRIEWLYASEDTPSAIDENSQPHLPQFRTLKQLYEFANMGDLEGLMAHLDALSKDDSLLPFTNYLSAPARNFELLKVRELLKNWMEQTAVDEVET